MTTATKDPAAEKVFSERELEKQEAVLRETREKVAEMRDREAELSAQVATALESGEDVAELREERREVRGWLSDMEPAIPVLEERIRERRLRKLTADAEERLQEVKKKVGGLTGEAPRRAEKARELAEKLVAQLEWLAGANMRRTLLQKEARALANAYDLEVPDLKSFEADPAGAVSEVKRTIRGVSPPRESLALGEDGQAARALASLTGEESPTPELLEALEGSEPEAA